MSGLLHNPVFFYAVSFVIFIAATYKFARKPVLEWIDGQIKQISAELQTARELRAEAEAALADCKAKQARAESEAALIIESAKQRADDMQKKAAEDLAHMLDRQKQLAEERIHLAQQEAIEMVRNSAISMGMDIARKQIETSLKANDVATLTDEAIASIASLKTAK